MPLHSRNLQNNQGSARTLQRFWCAHLTQLFTRTVEVTMSVSYRIASLSRPKAALGMDGRLQEADGWQPKSFSTAAGIGNQPAGDDPESNRDCPGPLIKKLWSSNRRFLKTETKEPSVSYLGFLIARGLPQREKAKA